MEIGPEETGAIVDFGIAAIDNLDPSPRVESYLPPGSFFPRGISRVTCVAIDDCGNRTTRSFTVTVAEPESACDSCQPGLVMGETRRGETLTYPTITQALSDANTDDLATVLVCAGDYDEVPVLNDLRDLDIIACGPVTLSGFILKRTTNVTITGFDIDALGTGGGIQVGFGEPFINTELTLGNCKIRDANGAGIVVAAGNGRITIDRCEVTGSSHTGIILDGRGGPYRIGDTTFFEQR